MPLFNKACCCLKLKTGTAIIGWLGCIQNALNILILFIELIDSKSTTKTPTVMFKMAVLAVAFGASYLLINAARKDDHRSLIPWLCFNGFLIVVIIILLIVFATAVEPNDDMPQPIILVSILGIMDVWWLYVWLCIYSYYQELTVIVVVV